MSTSYTRPPPSYGATKPGQNSNHQEAEPLLGEGSGGIFNQPEPGDLPDDFKYGVTVSESAPEIRHAFIRKVYTLLFTQILGTAIFGGILSHSSVVPWVATHIWSFYLATFGSLILFGLLYWKRHSHPLNYALLAGFTLCESFTLGILIAFYDQTIVLQALLITIGVFVGLTLFTFQSKYDFSGLGPYLFAGLLTLIMAGFIGIFFPFSRTMDLIYAVLGCLIFSLYIVYDTFLITTRLSPDEFILGAISLYLELIVLQLHQPFHQHSSRS
jgi:FtsH-binding integral membrane protein